MKRDLDIQSGRQRHRLDARFEERVASEGDVMGVDLVAIAVVVDVEEEALLPFWHLLHLDAALGVGADRDVQHGAVLRKPSVRPAAEIADSYRRKCDVCSFHILAYLL